MTPVEPYRLAVCGGPRCAERGADALYEACRQRLRRAGLLEQVALTYLPGVCHGKCRHGPNLFVTPGAVWYGPVTADDLDRIISQHLVRGVPVEELRRYEPAVLELDGQLPW